MDFSHIINYTKRYIALVSAVITIGTAYWYIEDQQRAMEDLLQEIERTRKQEQDSDNKWMHDDETRHARQDVILQSIQRDIAHIQKVLKEQTEIMRDAERAHMFIADKVFHLHYRLGEQSGAKEK